jgi:hypothetical protein
MIKIRQLSSAVAASVLLLATGSAFASIMTSSGASNGFSTPSSGAPDPMMQFSIDLMGNDATALLNTTALGGGNFWATSGTLNVTSGADAGTYSLVSGGPGVFLSPTGAFEADNVLYTSTTPYLDTWGLLFSGGGTEINIFTNNPGQGCSATQYCFWSYNSSGYNIQTGGDPSSVSLSTVPEPASLALFGIGILLLGAGVGVRRRGLS